MGSAVTAPAAIRTKFTVRYQAMTKCYVVISPAGAICSAPTSKDGAERLRDARQAEADGKAKRGPRACMCCGATFASDGFHNRMCQPCRTRARDFHGDPHTIGRKT